jgi:hypothetical protein
MISKRVSRATRPSSTAGKGWGAGVGWRAAVLCDGAGRAARPWAAWGCEAMAVRIARSETGACSGCASNEVERAGCQARARRWGRVAPPWRGGGGGSATRSVKTSRRGLRRTTSVRRSAAVATREGEQARRRAGHTLQLLDLLRALSCCCALCSAGRFLSKRRRRGVVRLSPRDAQGREEQQHDADSPQPVRCCHAASYCMRGPGGDPPHGNATGGAPPPLSLASAALP